MKTLLFAYRDVGAYCLKFHVENNKEVVGVVVPPNDKGNDTWCLSVRKIALKNGLRIFDPGNLKKQAFIKDIAALRPDIIFSCYYPKIIPKDILNIPTHGAINLHGGLLPKYRGCFSGAWSIINDEKVTGVTMHYMEPKIDTGDIIGIKRVEIFNEDTGFSIYQKVGKAAIEIFKEKYSVFEKYGRIPGEKQNRDLVKYYGRDVPFGGKINWGMTKREIYNLIRSLYFPPFKPAFTTCYGRDLLIWEAIESEHGVKGGNKAIVGEIVAASRKRGITVSASDGCVDLTKAGWQKGEDDSIPSAYDLIENNELKYSAVLF